MKVLIVEDYADCAETLALVLSVQGHEPKVARDGEAALQACEEWTPELVLLDIALPGMDGYEVAHRMRVDLHLKCPIIAVSGYAPKPELQKWAGIDAYWLKPLTIERLHQAAPWRPADQPSSSAAH